MTVWLTQAEADALFAKEKHRVREQRWRLPNTGGGIVVLLVSADGDEPFHLDISRGRINLAKGKIQNRARTTMVLAPIDFGGAPHRNSDDENLIMAWIDTKDSRPESSEPFAFLNDNEKTIAGNVTDALRNYGITPVGWSQRDQFRERLVA